MTAVDGKPAEKTTAKRSSAKAGLIVMAESKTARRARTATLQFGSASLKVGTGGHDDWSRNVDLGQAALKKMKLRLVKPGVKLRNSRSAPLFHADPADPGRLIRELNGKKERGVFERGVFKVIA